MTHLDFPDLAGINPEVTLVPIVELMPFHRRPDAGLHVKRLKEPSSSAELVLVIPCSQLKKNIGDCGADFCKAGVPPREMAGATRKSQAS